MEEKKTVRVILNVPSDLNERYVELAKKRGIPKSAMIMFSMSWYLDYNDTLELMPKMVEALKNSEDLEKRKTKKSKK